MLDSVALSAQDLVLQRPRPGIPTTAIPIVEPARGDLDGLAEHKDGMFVSHRVHPLVALGDGSERIPRVFFRISRCSRRWRFSLKATSSWTWISELELLLPPAPAPPQRGRGAGVSATHTGAWNSVWFGFKDFMLLQLPQLLSVFSTQPHTSGLGARGWSNSRFPRMDDAGHSRTATSSRSRRPE